MTIYGSHVMEVASTYYHTHLMVLPTFIHSGNRLKNYPVSTSLKIRHIAEAPNGVLLIGTTNGLLTFSNKFDQPEEIKFYHSNVSSM